MELVDALEQLSLGVRNQKFNLLTENSASVSRQYHLNQQQNVDESVRYQLSTNSCKSTIENKHLRQLLEFDKSIETLFAQITDLDCVESQRMAQAPQMPSSAAHNRRETFKLYSHNANSKNHHSGSIETSQEEDSDCSSQRSSVCANGLKKDTAVNPLVKDLLRRDICAITDTVRKIGRILAVGNQLESISNSLSSSMKQDAEGNFHGLHPSYLQIADISCIKSLCNEFNFLCSSEQHIRDLPTIITYNEFCCNLLSLVNKLEPSFTPARYQAQQYALHNEDETILSCKSELIEVTDNNSDLRLSVEGDEEELDDDVAFLNCDQRHVDNWTENKLYINHPST